MPACWWDLPRTVAQRKVIGIDASFTPAQTKAQVLDIARNTAALVELGREIVEDDCVLIEDYAYPAYGVPSEETKEAIRLVRAARRHDHRSRSTRENPCRA